MEKIMVNFKEGSDRGQIKYKKEGNSVNVIKINNGYIIRTVKIIDKIAFVSFLNRVHFSEFAAMDIAERISKQEGIEKIRLIK